MWPPEMLIVMETMIAIPTPCARATPSGPMPPVVGPVATDATTLPAPRNTNSSVPTNSAVSGRRSLDMTGASSLWAAANYANRPNLVGVLRAAQHQGGVDSAEPERVGEHHIRCRGAALAGQAVQVAGGIGTLEIDPGGKPAPLHRERADRRLDRAARAERVAIVALRAAHAEPVGMVAEDELDRPSLGGVVERRGRPVGVDVADLDGRYAGVGKGEVHRPGRLAAVGTRRGHV